MWILFSLEFIFNKNIFMKVLIAIDSFKDSLSASSAAKAVREGFLKGNPGADVITLPMADGGEGTVSSLIEATEGTVVELEVMDPLMRPVKSFYGISGDGMTAIIEMAAASGLEMLRPEERNPWYTTTFGTGQLIADALEKGCRKFLLGIGGSATNDCGAGMAEALGVLFRNASGEPVSKGGGALGKIHTIDLSGMHPDVLSAEIHVACDVDNPLCGPKGASAVYGPQKGADPEMVQKLDKNLNHFSSLIASQLGKDVDLIAGSGAAGGLGAGLIAFLDATLMKGFDMVAEISGLEDRIKEADLVITGEGKIDDQTRFGKTPYGVALFAKKYNKPVIAVGGKIDSGAEVLYDFGINAIFPISDGPLSLEESISRTAELLEMTGERIARTLLI